MGIGVHAIISSLVQVLNETEVERSPTVLVALELGNCRLGRFGGIEANNASAPRTTAGLVLNLSLLNLSNGGE